MEFQEVLRRRRMVRRYDMSRPVPPEVVDRLAANALRAPSAGFSQGWGFLVLDRPDDVARFRDAATPPARAERWFAATFEAPLVIVPLRQQGRLPRPLRRGGQRFRRPLRRLVAGTVLGYRHRLRLPAHPADRGGRRARRLLLRPADRPDRLGTGRVRRARPVPPHRGHHGRLSRRAVPGRVTPPAARRPGHPSGSLGGDRELDGRDGSRGHSPVLPSSSSLVASACPAWRAVSLMRWRSAQRRSLPSAQLPGSEKPFRGMDRTAASVAIALSR